MDYFSISIVDHFSISIYICKPQNAPCTILVHERVGDVAVLVDVLLRYQLVRADVAGFDFVNHADIDFVETVLAWCSHYWSECCHISIVLKIVCKFL